ncbi:MAG: acetyl-CoA C-acyltransferase [Bacteroidetes bacterium]|jgi:3-oxoadipyl-CoA thiolase|nr:acetyl-CoA C-acyltransferase [Bacteroidota bacterium]
MRATSDAFLIDATRTPVGRYGGALSSVRPDDLSALILKSLVQRTGVDPGRVDDVLWGCANQAGEDNRNIGRMGVLLAGFPVTVPATTINRLCGSSLDAVNLAARTIWSGDADLIIAGGVESMSRAPYVIPKNVSGKALFGNLTAYDTALGWRFPNPAIEKLIPLESMGETAENIFDRAKISREDQDAFALRSHERAVQATIDERFAEELTNVEVREGKGETVLVAEDEGPRADTSLEQLARLKPAFRKNGTVTAGNSSSLNDGAAAILVASEKAVKEFHLMPKARIVSTGVAGVDPRTMGMGPVPATQQALAKSGLQVKHMDLTELNEAFAVQSLAVMRELGLDPDLTNVNGGAIALGHPLGCSGARIMTTLLHELVRRRHRYGLATMCIGVGQGIATIIERA